MPNHFLHRISKDAFRCWREGNDLLRLIHNHNSIWSRIQHGLQSRLAGLLDAFGAEIYQSGRQLTCQCIQQAFILLRKSIRLLAFRIQHPNHLTAHHQRNAHFRAHPLIHSQIVRRLAHIPQAERLTSQRHLSGDAFPQGDHYRQSFCICANIRILRTQSPAFFVQQQHAKILWEEALPYPAHCMGKQFRLRLNLANRLGQVMQHLQLPDLPTALLIQPGVLNRYRRLGSERLRQRNMLGLEIRWRTAINSNHTDQALPDEQRYPHPGADACRGVGALAECWIAVLHIAFNLRGARFNHPPVWIIVSDIKAQSNDRV